MGNVFENLITEVLSKTREVLAEHPEIHQIPGNKARIYAVEDDILGAKIESMNIAVKEGVVHIDRKEIALIKPGGVGVSLCRYDNWHELLNM